MKNIKKIATFGFSILLGLTLGLLSAPLIDRVLDGEGSTPEKLLKIAVVVVILYISFILQIILHEGGHLIFGLLSGYQFSSFRVYSFMLKKENDRLKLCRFSLAGTAGQCLMAPPDLKDGYIPYKLYNLGGILINILTVLVCGPLFLVTPEGSILQCFLLLMAVLGIAFAFMNGIPVNNGSITNDGANVIALGKDSEALKAFWLQMKVNEMISRGITISEMPEEWFELPDEDHLKNPIACVTAFLRCNYLLEKGKYEESREYMEYLLSKDTAINGVHKGLLRCDLAAISALRDEIFEEKWMDKEQQKFMKTMKNFPSVIRTNYIYALLVNKDPEEAEKYKLQMEKVARTYPNQCELIQERKLIELADQKAA
ncbi:MAG: hypothetical protein KBT01_09640 [Clostridiales bacterium]|nr:hypothetical protein [Candidatus Blautia equi]